MSSNNICQVISGLSILLNLSLHCRINSSKLRAFFLDDKLRLSDKPLPLLLYPLRSALRVVKEFQKGMKMVQSLLGEPSGEWARP
jgi:hypothetical protein